MKKQKIEIVYDSAPLPDEYSDRAKKCYLICGICCLIGVVITPLLAIGGIGFIFCYAFLQESLGWKRDDLRRKKFKFVENMDNDRLFAAIQPVLISKYGMELEHGKENIVVIHHNKIIYDIHINGDNTFTIWWRMSAARAFFAPDRRKKEYAQIRAAMGIIAFEIQRAFGINLQETGQIENGGQR